MERAINNNNNNNKKNSKNHKNITKQKTTYKFLTHNNLLKIHSQQYSPGSCW